MKHNIDPKVDCVFKALLGAKENRELLVHFLNAVLGSELATPIVSVEILNPYNEKEFLDDKLTIVDVKASDNNNQIYQVEVQLAYYADLPARITYTWADIYCQQLKSGHNFNQLQPTYSIWLLGQNAIKDDDRYLHAYKLRDETGKALTPYGGIWLLELEKFHSPHIENEQERWLQFFKKGDSLNDEQELPDWMNTQEMRQAMNTLRQFSEKDRNYFAYQARQNYIRQQNSLYAEKDAANAKCDELVIERNEIAAERDEIAAERDAIALREQEAVLREQHALAEIAKLKALLAEKNKSM